MGEEIIVIGCGAAGGTAAQFARKTNREANVTIFERTGYPQYSKCALPYLISGKIEKPGHIIEFSQEWFEKAKIKLFLNSEVSEIDNESKKVLVKRRDGKKIEINYDKLILATGAKPAIPPIKNIFINNNKLKEGVFTLRAVDDALNIVKFARRGENAIVIGGGLIGLEVAEALHTRGMNVTIVEMLPNILPSMIDEDMSKEVCDYIEEHVKILTNHVVLKINGDNKVESVTVKNNYTGEEFDIPTKLVVISTGIKPNVELAEAINCKIGETGGIVVNEKCETSIEDVYAVGDCTQYYDYITRKPFLVGLGSIGVRQGIVAGINAAGGNIRLFDGFLQTRATKVFDIEIAAVGPTIGDMENIKSVIGKFRGSSHPEYYPENYPVTVKVFCDAENRRIIAAQIIGNNAAQRVNTLACAILNKMFIDDFIKFETAYAPPIAPTIDPIAAACESASLKLKRIKF
jgi:NADH oxidase (H2O2-forming)